MVVMVTQYCKFLQPLKCTLRNGIHRNLCIRYILPQFLKYKNSQGVVAHTCNPSTLGGQEGQITKSGQNQSGQYSETPSLLKIQNVSRVWWRVPVVPATREAEAGELPEPRRRRLR